MATPLSVLLIFLIVMEITAVHQPLWALLFGNNPVLIPPESQLYFTLTQQVPQINGIIHPSVSDSSVSYSFCNFAFVVESLVFS